MLHVDEYLKLAASSFKIAEAKFQDAEEALHTLENELENCLECLTKLRQDELSFWENLDELVYDSQPDDLEELYPVSY